mmetsp:Transcript_50146/g.145732  ORF Transcript_50146/g.145732 Transcript_50146/m.145732 type:complete len:180 (+) Transcript_50146:139-678(+)|eukprot:CAMPEP_0170306666 /NCGR_PEP_ID=MMETSP0116_2-20130129/53728_1 /TAXON_ID=400756 /ORGANISM="Durinskia baltica, Strain CSIRO CS-38" /LENGTH=179 /DNA_ID=CAMNT_0010558759 /DNA_START=49 /DNA_END=588 /DNA_ORIENTATION=-
MKLSQIVFFLVLAIISLATAKEGAAAAAETAGEAAPAAVEVNCDEICASQVAEATRVVNQAKAELEAQLSPLQFALDQAKEASVSAASEVTTLKGQLVTMEGAVATAKAEAEAVKTSAAASEAAATAKLAAMELELEGVKAKLKEYESARYVINKNVIKAEFMGVLKKYGLVKDEEKEL